MARRPLETFPEKYFKTLMAYRQQGFLKIGPFPPKAAQSLAVGFYHYRDALHRRMKADPAPEIVELIDVYEDLVITKNKVGPDQVELHFTRVPIGEMYVPPTAAVAAVMKAGRMLEQEAQALLAALDTEGWKLVRKEGG